MIIRYIMLHNCGYLTFSRPFEIGSHLLPNYIYFVVSLNAYYNSTSRIIIGYNYIILCVSLYYPTDGKRMMETLHSSNHVWLLQDNGYICNSVDLLKILRTEFYKTGLSRNVRVRIFANLNLMLAILHIVNFQYCQLWNSVLWPLTEQN